MGLKHHLIYFCPRPVEALETLELELESIIRYVGAGNQPVPLSVLSTAQLWLQPQQNLYMAISSLLFHTLDLTK